jgi:hypothetical protein
VRSGCRVRFWCCRGAFPVSAGGGRAGVGGAGGSLFAALGGGRSLGRVLGRVSGLGAGSGFVSSGRPGFGFRGASGAGVGLVRAVGCGSWLRRRACSGVAGSGPASGGGWRLVAVGGAVAGFGWLRRCRRFPRRLGRLCLGASASGGGWGGGLVVAGRSGSCRGAVVAPVLASFRFVRGWVGGRWGGRWFLPSLVSSALVGCRRGLLAAWSRGSLGRSFALAVGSRSGAPWVRTRRVFLLSSRLGSPGFLSSVSLRWVGPGALASGPGRLSRWSGPLLVCGRRGAVVLLLPSRGGPAVLRRFLCGGGWRLVPVRSSPSWRRRVLVPVSWASWSAAGRGRRARGALSGLGWLLGSRSSCFRSGARCPVSRLRSAGSVRCVGFRPARGSGRAGSGPSLAGERRLFLGAFASGGGWGGGLVVAGRASFGPGGGRRSGVGFVPVRPGVGGRAFSGVCNAYPIPYHLVPHLPHLPHLHGLRPRRRKSPLDVPGLLRSRHLGYVE